MRIRVATLVVCATCLLLASALPGCAARHARIGVPSTGPAVPTSSELQIYFAVMSYLVSGGVSPPSTVFVQIRRQDPPVGFLLGFAGLPCKLEPGSRFREAHGLLTNLGTIRWSEPTLVEVEGSNEFDRYLGSGWVATVEYKEGGWQVREIRPTWIR